MKAASTVEDDKKKAKSTVGDKKQRGGQRRAVELVTESLDGDSLHNFQSRAHKKAKKISEDKGEDKATTKEECRVAYANATASWHRQYNPHLANA